MVHGYVLSQPVSTSSWQEILKVFIDFKLLITCKVLFGFFSGLWVGIWLSVPALRVLTRLGARCLPLPRRLAGWHVDSRTGTQTGRETGTQTDRHEETSTQTDRQVFIQTSSHKTRRQIHRQVDKNRDMQTNRQRKRQICKYASYFHHFSLTFCCMRYGGGGRHLES